MSSVKVNFLAQQKEVEVSAGSTLLQAAAKAGVPVEGNCGGKGTCGKCKARIVSGGGGKASPVELKYLSPAELETGWVLACQCSLWNDVVVEVRAQKDAYHRKSDLNRGEWGVAIEPSVEKILVSMTPPSVEDQTPDCERLLGHLPQMRQDVSRDLLSALPRILREAEFKVTAAMAGGRLLAVEPGDTTARKFGLAFDIGTTTVVGSLVDLNSGEVLADSAATNPQNVFGADVISRINHAAGGGLRQLQDKVVGAVNSIIRQLLAEAGINKNEVYEAVVVGNTTMSHLFLGIDPTYLAPAPFIPAFSRAVEVGTAELGLDMHPGGRVVVLPNIAGYVGSDTVGVMLATRIEQREGICLAVDIGTNGEVVLSGRGRILTCSTAAGPAFEGAQIRHGMRAAEGAIEAVSIDGDVTLKVIGNTAPRGICGSGLIDAVAEMAKSGVIDATGRFVGPGASGLSLDPRLMARLRRGENGCEFVLAPAGISAAGEDIVITQKDLRELQLAKGAIYAGIRVLLRELGVSGEDVTQVLLAGAFGNYIKKESALAIGLLPEMPLDRINSVGNAAGDGAKLALVSKSERARALSLARRAEHVELSTRAVFQEEFINALYFPAGN